MALLRFLCVPLLILIVGVGVGVGGENDPTIIKTMEEFSGYPSTLDHPIIIPSFTVDSVNLVKQVM